MWSTIYAAAWPAASAQVCFGNPETVRCLHTFYFYLGPLRASTFINCALHYTRTGILTSLKNTYFAKYSYCRYFCVFLFFLKSEKLVPQKFYWSALIIFSLPREKKIRLEKMYLNYRYFLRSFTIIINLCYSMLGFQLSTVCKSNKCKNIWETRLQPILDIRLFWEQPSGNLNVGILWLICGVK